MAQKSKKPNFPYNDATLNAEQRAADLLSRMSNEDKAYQLMAMLDGSPNRFEPVFCNDEEKMKQVFGKGIHSVQPFFEDLELTIASRNSIQKYLLEKTPWGIPALFVDEGQHGLMKPQSTVFPMAIGLACSWDVSLFEQVYSVTAAEMRSRGTHMALSPVIDVCRDPRWGRVEETYGEDPFLNGIYGMAAVKGFQGTGTGEIAANHVGATLKHFCGHGQPEGGLNQAPANYSERVLREYQFLPFKMTVTGAKPLAVMPSYNEIDGIPSHYNHWLLTGVLRNEWNFTGLVVSDWNAIDQLEYKHLIAESSADAAMKAFNAGVQCELPNANYYKWLPQLITEGKVSQALFDSAVYDVLFLKFKLGLFDNPYVEAKNAIAISKKPESAQLALKAAHESMVLLKNENNLLPLSVDKYKTIAVIGPCANDVFLGGYSGEPYSKVTLYEGIKQKTANKSRVVFAQGCKIVDNLSISQNNWKTEEIKFSLRDENLVRIKEAVEVAKTADVVILALGETEHICREAWSRTHLGDNMTLDLIGEQNELFEAIIALGKPVVVYLMNGRPLSINAIAQKAPAIIEGWYMGQATGTAAADIIFGDVNPSGKLTITFPKSAGQLPVYYNHKPSAQYHDYVSQSVEPLFPFGFGLSYTQFEYSNLKLSAETIAPGEKVTVTVDITNKGTVKGDEIVQLYLHDKLASITRPVKELKGFERISLAAGETKTVSFAIDENMRRFYNINMKFTEEPGITEIMVGGSSVSYLTTNLTVK